MKSNYHGTAEAWDGTITMLQKWHNDCEMKENCPICFVLGIFSACQKELNETREKIELWKRISGDDDETIDKLEAENASLREKVEKVMAWANEWMEKPVIAELEQIINQEGQKTE